MGNRRNLVEKIIRSWASTGGVESTESILSWIEDLNESTCVRINECSIKDDPFWFYDNYHGEIVNQKNSFFSIKGMRRFEDGVFTHEQPIISQPEIGYLGIICRDINGILHFLMQAKIEPGNVNCVQISPTIQATKSNFMRVHGGKLPAYFELFDNSNRYEIVYDQIQSEQATRFYKKRNRNIIMIVNDDIEVFSNFRWMTLGQIKKLMEIDNLVNMDTRSVLSGLPLVTSNMTDDEKMELKPLFKDCTLFESLFHADIQDSLPRIYHRLNDVKMFRDIYLSTVPLNQLKDWNITDYGVTCKKPAAFSIRYYDIEIPGREVRRWSQPLVKATGTAMFGLMTRVKNGIREYLVKIKPEFGSFDGAEVGPTIQWEPTQNLDNDIVESLFRERYEKKIGVMIDVVLSEEGGRFYHEQNKNVIIEIDEKDIESLPEDYVWVSCAALNYLVQINNCLNIQLRNLISLFKI